MTSPRRRAEGLTMRMTMEHFGLPRIHKEKGRSQTRTRLTNWDCNLAGNAIDFHVLVLGLSFHDAMRQITDAQ